MDITDEQLAEYERAFNEPWARPMVRGDIVTCVWPQRDHPPIIGGWGEPAAVWGIERVEKPAEQFPIGTHVRWHDASEDPTEGVVVGKAVDGWPIVEWLVWGVSKLEDRENPEYIRVVSPQIVSQANDLISNDVEPKEANWTPEWGKWWWDTRRTRGRMPEPPYKKGGPT